MRQSIIKKKNKKKEPSKPLDLNELGKDNKPLNARCMKCNKVKKVVDFYKSTSLNNKSGHTSLCKDCIQQMSVLGTGTFNERAVFDVCKQIDKPFLNSTFRKVKGREGRLENAKIGEYIRIINQEKYQLKGFKDGEMVLSDLTNTQKNDNNGDRVIGLADQTAEMIKLFGGGYTPEEYQIMYDKYSQLKNNYPEKTAMHKEALLKYCKYSMKEDMAIASSDTTSAKTWGDLAAKTATAAKINPSQLSAADLSGGITNFSQMALQVEMKDDMINELPQYVYKPHDAADYLLWEMGNWVRHLKGLPPLKYEEAYQFLVDRYNKNKEIYNVSIIPNNIKHKAESFGEEE